MTWNVTGGTYDCGLLVYSHKGKKIHRQLQACHLILGAMSQLQGIN